MRARWGSGAANCERGTGSSGTACNDTYRGTAPASGVDPATLAVTVDGVDQTSLFTKGPTQATGTIAPALSDGPHTLVASIRDAAGNERGVNVTAVDGLSAGKGRWGAISKTNGIGLRWRDPVYATLRELAMSYFHEYYNSRNAKTLRTYSRPFDLRRMDPGIWATSENGSWDMIDALEAARHYKLVTRAQERALTRRDPFESRVGNLLQYRKPKRARAPARTRHK